MLTVTKYCRGEDKKTVYQFAHNGEDVYVFITEPAGIPAIIGTYKEQDAKTALYRLGQAGYIPATEAKVDKVDPFDNNDDDQDALGYSYD